MDAVQWSQGIGFVKQSEDVAAQSSCTNRQLLEKKPRPQEQINCPRCNSSNTKFCYYNNYSLTQPRYFCKSCRRYWTEGGTLRNVPVGGGSRKNRRPSQSSASASSKVPDLNPPSIYQLSSQNPKIHEGQDLNLAFPASQDYGTHGSSHHSLQVPKYENGDNHDKYYYHPFSVPNKSGSTSNNGQFSLPCSSSISSTLELLRTGNAAREFNNFLATPMSADTNTMYTSGIPSQESKPNLTFSINGGVEPRYWNLNELQGNGGRLLFPIGEQKDHPSTTEMEENKVQGNSAQCWDGTFTGRSW